MKNNIDSNISTDPDKPIATMPVRINRRTYVDGCATCESVKANGGFGPAHDPSYGCECGKHAHCSCDTCFTALLCWLAAALPLIGMYA